MSSSHRRFTDLKLGIARIPLRRRIWGALTIGLPSILAMVGGAMEPRVFPGGTFIEPGSAYPGWWRVTLLVGCVASIASIVMWTIYNGMAAPPARRNGSLVIGDDELVVFADGAQQTFARSSVVNVFIEDSRVGVALDDGRTLSFGTDDPDVRRRIRAALAPEPRRDRAVLPVGGATRAFVPLDMLVRWLYVVMLPILVSLMGLVADQLAHGSARLVPHLLATTAIVGGLWLGLRRREVVIGADGVRVDGTSFDTFVPHDAIERVTHFSNGNFIVHHSGGKKLRLPHAPGNGELKERIEKARDVPRGEAPPVDGLARSDRSEGDWREALDALAEDRSYRAGALRVEDVEATLADPGARPEERVGAAIALREREDGRERIRIASETTADADLQAALEAAAEGEIAERPLRRAQRRFDARKKA